MHPNGTVFVICHNNGLYLIEGETLGGPYKNKNLNTMPSRWTSQLTAEHGWIDKVVWEDPHLWFDADGNWHVICHTYPQGGGAFNVVVGGHGFSADGLEWHWSALPPFTVNVTHASGNGGGGKTVTYGTRERPFLFGTPFKPGRPAALFSGVTIFPKQKVGHDYSFTLVQSIIT